MTNKPLRIFAAFGGCWFVTVGPVLAQSTVLESPVSARPVPPIPGGDDIGKQLSALRQKIESRIAEDKNNGTRATPKTWADILLAYDNILAAHKNEKTDRVAEVAMRKDLLYGGYFNSPETSIQLLAQMIKDYPNTLSAQMAATFVDSFKMEAAAIASRRLWIGTPLPDFQVSDLTGKILSPAVFLGKVVLLDYWSNACAPKYYGPYADVKGLYLKYHDKGFEILGVVSGPQPAPKFTADLQAENMPWPEYYQGPLNAPIPLASLPQPRTLPGNYLVGRDGKIIGLDLFGEDLDDAVAKAVAAK